MRGERGNPKHMLVSHCSLPPCMDVEAPKGWRWDIIIIIIKATHQGTTAAQATYAHTGRTTECPVAALLTERLQVYHWLAMASLLVLWPWG